MDTVRDPVYVDYDYYARHQLVQPTGEEKSLIERLLVTAEDITVEAAAEGNSILFMLPRIVDMRFC